MDAHHTADVAAPCAEAIAETWNAAGPAREALINATSRWGVLTLPPLLDGPLRFAALRRAIGGISDRMLSQTLQLFEIDGLVERRVLGQIPPHVEYRLTASGQPVAMKMAALIAAIHDQLPAILESRSRRSSTNPAISGRAPMPSASTHHHQECR